MCFGGLLQRKYAIDHWTNPAGAQIIAETRNEPGYDLRFFFFRSGAQHRADDLLTLAQNRSDVNLHFSAAAHRPDEHHPTAHPEGLEIAREIARADMIENDVRAVGTLHEIFGSIVDRQIGAVCETSPAFLIGSGCDEDAQARELGECRGRGADAASAAVNEKRLAAFCPRELEHC